MPYKDNKRPNALTFIGSMCSTQIGDDYIINGIFTSRDLDELRKNINPDTNYVAWYIAKKKTVRRKNSNRLHYMALAPEGFITKEGAKKKKKKGALIPKPIGESLDDFYAE